jgi:hypothetical protein
VYNHKIVNTITGEEIIKPLSAAEIKEIESNILESKKEIANVEIQSTAKAQAKAKLGALGLTEDDLKALGL